MADVESLINTGQMVRNAPATDTAEKTVVVVGVARSGTTMVASVLDALGVCRGEGLGPVLEDIQLSEAIERDDRATLRACARERNQHYTIWGWKRPAAFEQVDIWRPEVRNPHVIAVYRDPFAIANRNRISMLSDGVQAIRNANHALSRLTEFVASTDLPILVCSYEKALMNHGTFVAAVDGFLGLGASSRWPQAQQAIGSTDAYLQASRITAAEGYVDVVSREYCAGWTYYEVSPRRSVRVTVYVDGRPVGETLADARRPDVKQAGFHPTGKCGFYFYWPATETPAVGARVEVWAEGDIAPLHGANIVQEPTAHPA